MKRLGEWLYALWARRHPAPAAPAEPHDPWKCISCMYDIHDALFAAIQPEPVDGEQ